jgi:hypothetical protein
MPGMTARSVTPVSRPHPVISPGRSSVDKSREATTVTHAPWMVDVHPCTAEPLGVGQLKGPMSDDHPGIVGQASHGVIERMGLHFDEWGLYRVAEGGQTRVGQRSRGECDVSALR